MARQSGHIVEHSAAEPDLGVATQGADDWKKVLAALADEQWDFRTVEGIARGTGLVASVLPNFSESIPTS